MKILYHHRTRATDAQGIHISEIARAMRDLGHTVEIASLTASQAEAANTGVAGRPGRFTDVVQLGYNLAGLPYLLWKIYRGGMNVIYERYSLFNFAGVVAAKLARIPLILEVNSPLALEESRERASGHIPLAYWAERVICNLATNVVVVSSPLRRILVANDVDETKLLVMANGVNLTAFSGRAHGADLRGKLGLAGKTVIGFAGWFKTWHRVDLLIAAFAEQRLFERGAALLIVGDGPAMAELLALTADRKLSEWVKFSGAVPHKEIPTYVDLFDIAVQPAANEYCCPMKILEYMTLGKAIVAPRQENVQELLHGDEARFFAPGDGEELGTALRELVDDQATRNQIAARARQAILERGYLWSRNAERVLALVSLPHRGVKQLAVSGDHPVL